MTPQSNRTPPAPPTGLTASAVSAPPRPPTSLTARMVLRTSIACAAVFLLAGLVLGLWLRYAFRSEFDRALLAKAQAVCALMEEDSNTIKFEDEPETLAPFGDASRREFYQVWDHAGRVMARSPSLHGADLPRAQPAPPRPAYADVTLPNGRRGRTVTLPHTPRPEEDRPGFKPQPITLVVAGATRNMAENLSETLWLTFWVFAVSTLASAVIVGWAAATGLRPVRALADRIAATGESNLSDRFDPDNLPAELRPVADRLNELLARIESALAREKSFTADVAHELRTPISGLETALEVCAAKPRSPDEYRTTIDRCLSTVRSTHELIDNLLLLARADARQLSPNLRPVELEPLLRQCWQPLESRAAARGLTVNWDLPPNLTIESDPALLSLVLRNVLDNAVTYADVAGSVEISAHAHSDRCEIVILNTGCSLTPAEAAHLFDRFWRADPSRSATGTHAGLGLSLCQKIMPLLQGTIDAAIEPSGTFSVTIRSPGRASGAPTSFEPTSAESNVLSSC